MIVGIENFIHRAQCALVCSSPRSTLFIAASAEPLVHHRIFWREESTSASLWGGVHRAIEETTCASVVLENHKQGQLRLPCEDPGGDSPTATLLEVFKVSDLQRLLRLLTQGKIEPSCAETIAAAVQDGNPAIVEMILRHGSEHVPRFLDTFRSWVRRTIVTDIDGQSRRASTACTWILPLHSSCHAGSPEVVNVLLTFMAECYSSGDSRSMVNAKDAQGRTALHLASWSPRPLCPGRRHAIVRWAKYYRIRFADVSYIEPRAC